MDWPNIHDPYVTTYDWKYEQPTSETDDQSFVLYTKWSENAYRVQPPQILSNIAKWSNSTVTWLQSPFFSQNLLEAPGGNQPDISGFHILFPSRVKHFDEIQLDDEKLIPREHWYLPFSDANWERIIKHFHLNRVILDAMMQDKCYTGFQEKRLRGRHTIQWFTGVTSQKADPRSASMSAVYFPQFRLSLGVIFNCDKGQKDLVKKLLRRSPEVSSHSLLMVGVFVEIQRDRIVALMDDVTEQLDTITTMLSRELDDFDFEQNQQLTVALVAAKNCEEETRVVRSQLEKIITHAKEHEKADHKGASVEYIHTTRRFNIRLRQIDDELEGIAAQCRVKAEELRTTSDLYLAQLARNEAREAASLAHTATKQAEISKHIAFIAMVYLPITAVSTIFATPVFKFENNWVDWSWKFKGETKEDGSPEHDMPVFSGYFVVYFILSIGLTYTTWWSFSRKVKVLDKLATLQTEKCRKRSGFLGLGRKPSDTASRTATPLDTTSNQVTPSLTSRTPWYQRLFLWSKSDATTITATPSPEPQVASTTGVVTGDRNDGGIQGNTASAAPQPTIWSRFFSVFPRIRRPTRRRNPANAIEGHQLRPMSQHSNVPTSNQAGRNHMSGSMV